METTNITYEFIQMFLDNRKLKPYDIIVSYIYKNRTNKPFYVDKSGNIKHYQYFYAKDNNGKIIDKVVALSPAQARDKFLKKIKKGTKRYSKWESSKFIVSYEPMVGFEIYLKERLKEDFPEIENINTYLSKLYYHIEEIDFNKLKKLRNYDVNIFDLVRK